jgi:diacylglycerol O-acyltransferase
MYLNGAPLVGTFPVSAVAASVGFNATLTSYHDRMDFGFVGNGASMYDLPSLALHVGEAYEELKAAAAKRRPARGPGKRARVAKARRTR